MENDVLKNKIAPWQEKGRWYHAKIDLSTHDFDNKYTDKFIIDNFTCSVTYNAISLVSNSGNIKIIDFKYYCINDTYTGNTKLSTEYYVFTNGRVLFTTTAGNSTAGIMELWLFAIEL